MDATPPFLRGRPGPRTRDSAEGSTASATPSWRPQTPSQMERDMNAIDGAHQRLRPA